VAERVEDPARNVPRATLLGLGATLIVYVIVSTGISFAVPPDDLARDSAPIATFVARYLGRWPGDAVALFASISAIGCLNATVVLLGELPLGLVRDGQLPEWMAPTNRHDVAARPLLFGCALGLALMLASTSGMGERVLDFLLRLTTASTLWLYVGVCIAGLMAGTMRAMAVIGLCFCAWVLYSAGLEAGGLSVLLLVAGVPMHFLMGGRTPSAIAA
jgi:APA family basic amino acid/polyamine antiporter